MQHAVALDEREARLRRRHQSIRDTEIAAQRHPLGLLNQQRVGSAVEDEIVNPLADDDAARTAARFDQHESDAAALKFVGRRQARNAAAHDHDVCRRKRSAGSGGSHGAENMIIWSSGYWVIW